MESIGEKIFNLRKISGHSQEELGFAVGVSRQTISKWESNAMTPNSENIKALCSVFNVSSEYFLFQDYTETKVSQVSNEVAVAADQTTKKENKKIIVLIILLSVLFVISTLATIILGCMTFTSNDGFQTIQTAKIDKCYFSITLIFSFLFLISEIVILVFKKKNECKVLLTNCK